METSYLVFYFYIVIRSIYVYIFTNIAILVGKFVRVKRIMNNGGSSYRSLLYNTSPLSWCDSQVYPMRIGTYCESSELV